MTWLDDIPDKQVEFESRRLEEAVRKWVRGKKEEVFAGLVIRFGYISDICLGRICQVVPFPNNSSTPETSAYPNEEWFKIMKDVRWFSRWQCEDYEVPFLGWLHSHPKGSDEFSEADCQFMGSLAQSDYNWDGHFAMLITWYPKRVYRYNIRYIKAERGLNEGNLEEVTFRTWCHSRYLRAI